MVDICRTLTIAGSDSSGGAGIQADIKTMTMKGVYAMSAITALTAQNTMGVKAIWNVDASFLSQQLDSVFEDIYPDSVKIGMVASSELIEVIADRLMYYKAKNIVVDPVMVATSGASLIKTDAVETLIEKLFPIATLITPNIPEAEVIANMKIISKEDMKNAASRIFSKNGCPVLLKGGHMNGECDDQLLGKDGFVWFNHEHIENPNSHGTGCTLSSAIAANLAKGMDLVSAVADGKQYVSDVLSHMLNIGKGSGPLWHNFSLQDDFVVKNT